MTETRPYPSFGLRFLAFLLDTLALGGVGGLLAAITRLDVGWLPGHILPSFGTLGSAVGVLALWLYAIVLTECYGGTLGKLALGLRVVRTDGQRLDWLTVTVRETIGKFVTALPLGLGFWWISWDSRKQGWHDTIAETVVVFNQPKGV